ncbi:37416_t:CDS:2 [Gigaspora margarita]|uniref:37416_t:CDS:1 n=1 Tax=Gigaspora margarita TaxID=4874 RepID=A0ABM8W034_GIGMA|nr:37416_t:CDS:2 [Gigaspora margarita]
MTLMKLDNFVIIFEACAITDEENEYNIHSKEAKNQLNIENNTSNTIDSMYPG